MEPAVGPRTVASGMLLATALAASLWAAHPAHAAWLQSGYDAARTGALPEAGPAWDDVAWMIRIPGSRAGGAHAGILQEGKAFVLSANLGLEGLEANALWEVDLATAGLRQVAELDAVPTNLAGDGARAFVVAGGSLVALGLPDGTEAWRWEPPALVAAPNRTACTNPAVRDGTVYLACNQFGAVVGAQPTPAGSLGTSATPQEQRVVYVVAVDAATGQPRWTWVKDTQGEAGVAPPAGAPSTPTWSRSSTGGLSVIGPYVMVLVTEERGGALGVPNATAMAQTRQDAVWALAEADGSLLWKLNASATRDASHNVAGVGGRLPPPLADAFAIAGVAPTGNANVAYLKLDALQAVNPARGVEIWRAAIGREDALALDVGAGFALSEDAVYVASSQTIYRFDPSTHEPLWHYTIDPETNEQWGGPSLALADGVLYARSFQNLNNSLYAFDAPTGRLLWKHGFLAERGTGGYFRFSIGEGIALVYGQDGTLWALGRTAASLGPVAMPSTAYPAPDEEVVVDLASTSPGVLGPPTAFRAEWGDGTDTGWQASPQLRHTYAEAGDVRARFHARNDAGQTASAVVTFFVGREAPVELNPLQRAFSPENQEQTFFLLGLAITGAATVPGILRLRRRQLRLRRELEGVDAVFAATRDRPSDCEAALAERKARARGLLVDGKLDQGQFHALERHVEDLAKGLRLAALDARFDFLPYGMVKTLREMLADGQISAWERRHFLEALERDALLTPEQKAKVRELVEGWFARDSGQPAPPLREDPAGAP